MRNTDACSVVGKLVWKPPATERGLFFLLFSQPFSPWRYLCSEAEVIIAMQLLVISVLFVSLNCAVLFRMIKFYREGILLYIFLQRALFCLTLVYKIDPCWHMYLVHWSFPSLKYSFLWLSQLLIHPPWKGLLGCFSFSIITDFAVTTSPNAWSCARGPGLPKALCALKSQLKALLLFHFLFKQRKSSTGISS